jgi:hypothetical protein
MWSQTLFPQRRREGKAQQQRHRRFFSATTDAVRLWAKRLNGFLSARFCSGVEEGK